jgi:exopolysaccharide production protein ExoQ
MTPTTLTTPTYETSWEYRASWSLWLCSAVSLAFIQTVPTIPAAIFLGAVLLYCALFPHRAYQAVTWNFIPWAIVLFGALSVLWSVDPARSARAAPQIAITVLASIMFAQALPARTFIAIVMYAHLSSVVASFFVSGIFGSKNSLALQVAITLLSSLWVTFDPQQPTYARLIGVLSLLGMPVLLFSAGSEGALVVGLLAASVSVVLFLSRPLNPDTRLSLFWLSSIALILALIVALLSVNNIFDLLLNYMGKDSSLTGRTVLWSNASRIITEHPWGGVGLQAFWIEGNNEAIRFWEMFYIDSHVGFHFHDLWLEIGVELGLIGILIAAGTLIVVIFSVWRWALREACPESCFFVAFVTFVLLRTVGEVELFGQFGLTQMIFLSAYYYAENRGTSLRKPLGRTLQQLS